MQEISAPLSMRAEVSMTLRECKGVTSEMGIFIALDEEDTSTGAHVAVGEPCVERGLLFKNPGRKRFSLLPFHCHCHPRLLQAGVSPLLWP
jgi:hypothetical protein